MYTNLAEHQVSSPGCPVCGSPSREVLFNVSDHEYKSTAQSFPLVKCAICECVYLSPRPNVNALSIIYPPEYNNFHAAEQAESCVRRLSNKIQSRRLRNLLRPLSLPSAFRVLDVGCGDGYCLDRIREAFPSAITFGVEPDQRSAEHVSRSHDVFCGLIEDYEASVKFDLIVSSHVVEHVEEPVEFLRKLSSLLSPGGVIVIDTPNIDCFQYRLFGRNWGGIHAPRHWTLFSESTFSKAARLAGLQIIEIQQLPINIYWVWSLHSALYSIGLRRFADRFFGTTACVSDRSLYYFMVMVMAELLERFTAMMGLGMGQIRVVMAKNAGSA